MKTSIQNTLLNRRDFLKIAFTSSAAVAFLSTLEACRKLGKVLPAATLTSRPTSSPTPTPTATLTPASTRTLAATPTSTAAFTSTAIPTLTTTPTTDLINLDINAFFEESLRRLLLRDPEALTISGLASKYGIANDQLTDVSEGYIRQTQALQASILELLQGYDRKSFSPTQALNAEVYEWYLADLVRGFPFVYNDYLVMPFLASLNWNLQFLFTEAHPFTDSQDAQDYITRLAQVSAKFAQAQDALQRREAFGVVLPRILIPDLIHNLKEYTDPGAAHPYYTTFVNKIGAIGSLSSADKKTLSSQAEQAIQDSVVPAYQSLMAYFNDLAPLAPEEIGVWRYSNGEAYYTHLLRHYTTTEFTAEEIHQLGLENVQRIQAEMRAIFSKLGYPANENLSVLIGRLGEDTGVTSGYQTVATYQAAIDQAVGLLDAAFDEKLSRKIVISGGEQGNYFMPSPLDGSRPPTFYASILYEQPKFRLKDIAFHEAVPGHGFQCDIASQSGLPLFREAIQFDAYVDGWALYAERLMWELGVYEEDPAGNIGRLDLELLRAVRCVLDTAIHSKKWSLNQAVQYMQEATGSRNEGEVYRYIMLPGQAVSYYVGFQKILEMRQRAMNVLGSKFNLKEFHHVLLSNGQLPLSFLEQLVDAYLEQKSQ